jgi:hypothetical protein
MASDCLDGYSLAGRRSCKETLPLGATGQSDWAAVYLHLGTNTLHVD